MIIAAAQFAAKCHAGQVRKYNGKPYITHPIRVAGRTATHPLATEALVAAAFLHDVVEDCGVELPKIDDMFGGHVSQCVYHLTNTPKDTCLPRAERKQLDRDRIAAIPKPCKVVKLIDRIDNLNEIDRTDQFSQLYAEESLLLVKVLEDSDETLAEELREIARSILKEWNQ